MLLQYIVIFDLYRLNFLFVDERAVAYIGDVHAFRCRRAIATSEFAGIGAAVELDQKENPMTIDATKGYQAALRAKEAELAQALRNRKPISIESSPEELEQTIWAADRELAVLALDRDSRLLREVRAALVRLETGEYGFCGNCEERIGPKRLSAIPWARYCIRCQEESDGGPREAALTYRAVMRAAA
jgi:DnaK suppressor protein